MKQIGSRSPKLLLLYFLYAGLDLLIESGDLLLDFLGVVAFEFVLLLLEGEQIADKLVLLVLSRQVVVLDPGEGRNGF